MTSSAQLEQEAEETRLRFAQTLDELRERITPGQLVDQAFNYAKDSGAGDFIRNLGRQMADNPLPVTLIGACMAWLMLANGGHSATANPRTSRAAAEGDAGKRVYEEGEIAGDRIRNWASGAKSAAADAGARASGLAETARSSGGETARSIQSRVSDTASSAAESASALYEDAKSRATEAYDRVSDATSRATSRVADSAAGLGERTAQASSNFLSFCREQPLFLAGLGLMLGAAIGAIVPATETEDRVMGETSDQLKDQARDIAQGEVEDAKAVVKSAVEPESQADNAQAAEASLVPAESHELSTEIASGNAPV